jgi:hypothetical protein
MCAESVFIELDLKPYRSPLVYKVYLGELLMYMGASSVGLNRISRGHHVVGKMLYHPAIRIEFMLCGSPEEAFKREEELIKEFKPILNRYRIIKDGTKVSFKAKRDSALEHLRNFKVAK